MIILNQKGVERFWSGVNCLGPDECWPWQRSCCRGGYGRFKLNGGRVQAHRIAWTLDRGRQIPDFFEDLPAHILHRCDNPPCCNPRHLFLGNQKVNNQDCAAKGRHEPKGVNNGRAGLTEANIKEIRVRYVRGGGVTYKELALMFGVEASAIFKIVARKTWVHIK